MLREFDQLISEAVDEGFQKGVELFVENLETDLSKGAVIGEQGLDNVLTELFNDYGIKPTVIEEDNNNGEQQ